MATTPSGRRAAAERRLAMRFAPPPISPPAPFQYDVYGIGVSSFLPLQDVREAEEGSEDVLIVEGSVLAHARRQLRVGCFDVGPGQVCLWHPRAGAVLVRDGRSLVVERVADADAGLLQTILLGQGVASLLLQRGRPTLHASAVAVGGAAVAFLGEKGAGKSTLAAALVRAGCPLVTDDLLVWTDGPSGPLAHPGYGLVKLWEPSVEAAGLAPEAAAPPAGAAPKWTWPTPPVGGPLPLRAVYALEFGDDFAIEPQPRSRTFVTLAQHTFAGALAEAAGQREPHLDGVARLARQTPVFRLVRPRSLDDVQAGIARLLEHVGGLEEPALRQ